MDIVVPAGMSYEFYTELTSGLKNVQEHIKSGWKNVKISLFRGNKCKKYTVFQGKVSNKEI